MERGSLRVALHTFGCRLNQYETDAIGRCFQAEGHEIVPAARGADLLVVNTCTVTEAADREARRFVRRWVSALGPGRVVVTGCAAQRQPRLFAEIPGVRLVAGNSHKHDLLPLLAETTGGGAVPIRLDAPGRRAPAARLASLRAAGHSSLARAYLRVQDGCSQRCTFCTLPSVRGTSGSLPVATLLAEARQLQAAGHRELVLTGAHLGSYGYDLRPRVRLGQLTGEILAAAPLCRVRLSSLEPRFVDEELLRLLAEEPRLCPHLHLPLQSADDDILARMRRAYRWPAYEASVRRALEAAARRACGRESGLALGSDFLVGFPGETDASFARTVERVRSLPFTYGHVFPYSEREGTPAAGLDGSVPVAIRRRRAAVLRALLAEKSEAYQRAQEGRLAEVVVEHLQEAAVPNRFLIRGTSERFLTVEAEGVGAPPRLAERVLVRVLEGGRGVSRGAVASVSQARAGVPV